MNNSNKHIKFDFRTLAFFLVIVIMISALLCTVVFFLHKNINDENEKSTNDNRPVLDEIRGIWVPTVYNITFPSKPDLSKEQLQKELDDILNQTLECSLNSIFFQVRPSCDALYNSDFFSVSRYLSSNDTLELDCLDYLIEKAHDKGVAVFAWINPLRVTASRCTVDELSENSTAYSLKSSIISYDGRLYFDAGMPEVRKLVCDGIKEIAENYNVDGIVFDDYFYPYPVYEEAKNGSKVITVFNDSESFNTYSSGESLEDFRRENINKLIKEAYETVKTSDSKILFGVAPFGIWQNYDGSNDGSLTKGSQSYHDNYSDTIAWLEGGYVDFIAPQLYWDMNSTAASYKVLAKWWSQKVSEANENLNDHSISLLISHAAYRYDDSFNSGEITKQLEYIDNIENSAYNGSVFYAYNAIKDNIGGVADEIIAFYQAKASTPNDKN